MKRIAFLVKTYPKISETFILEEILGLQQMGVPLHLFALQTPTDEITHAANARVRAPLTYVQPGASELLRWFVRRPVRALRALWLALRHRDISWKDLRNGACLARHLHSENIAHLHSHFISEPSTVAQVASLLANSSFSISAHAKDIYLSPVKVLQRKMAAANFTVTCTDHNLSYLSQHAPKGAQVSRMYHGIDLQAFDGTSDVQAHDAPMIVSVGRLKAKKGLHVLISACRILRDRGQRLRCEIIGYGEELDNLRALVAANDLQDVVTLSGKLDRDGVIARYRAASAFALPCIVTEDGDRDGIPNVLLEAMAMRLAVVTTPVSGIPELVEHERNGLLVNPNDPTALADALERILRDATLRERLGEQGRRTVANQCSNAHNLTHLKQLLTQRLATPPLAAHRLENIHAK